MNTDDFNIITIQNIDDEDFTFYFNKSAGTPPFTIKAGETKRFPKYIIKLGLKHLIDKILTKKGIRVNNQPARDELAKKIIIHEENFTPKAEPSEAQRVKAEVDRLNQPSELEKILSKKRKEAPPLPADKPISTTQQMEKQKEDVKKEPEKKELKEKFEELEPDKPKEKPKKKEIPIEEDDSREGISLPSKKELVKFATEELGLTFDDKLKKKFSDMEIKDLIKELQYPLEKLLQ